MALLAFVGLGIVVTLAALATLAAWIAIGSVVRVELEDRLAGVAVQLAIGAGVTSFLYAILAAAEQVPLAIWLVLGLEVIFLVARWPEVARAGRMIGEVLREMCAGRFVTGAVIVAFAVYWVNALAPPRDGDVVRYHLEHIRQIIADGAWLPIPDYHYALPFGWSLNYLPFERFGMPQGAHLLNLGLWILTVALLYQVIREQSDRKLALALCAVAVAQPLLLKSATTAHADIYVIFIMMTLNALLASHKLTPWVAFSLGFMGWIAAASRYQALALGAATIVVLLVWQRRGAWTRRHLRFCAWGAGLAVLIALPFYAFNWLHFRNPVWPLLVDLFNQPLSYADQVGAAYSQTLTGTWQPATILAGLREAFLSTYTFPVPHMVFGFLLLSLKWRTPVTTRLALFLASFLLLWVAAQPSIYLRFFIYLLPVAWVGVAGIRGAMSHEKVKAWIWRVTAVTALGLTGLAAYYSLDAFSLAVTGDRAKYHRTTWFYDVFEWVDNNTPPDTRFLVVLTGEPTYYLDRPHRRADPWFSGVVDWTAVQSADDLVQVMREGGYDYLLYEWRNWRRFPGGDQMIGAVQEVLDEGQLREVRRFDAFLSSSRVLRESHVTPVLLFELPKEPVDLTAQGSG